MNINITDKPNPQDEEFVIDSLWAHNHKTQPVDIHPLFLTVTDDNQQIVGGTVARTVGRHGSAISVGRRSMSQKRLRPPIDATGRRRSPQARLPYGLCRYLRFPGPGFYEKLGYRVYGELGDYAHRHTRHYG